MRTADYDGPSKRHPSAVPWIPSGGWKKVPQWYEADTVYCGYERSIPLGTECVLANLKATDLEEEARNV